MPEALVDLRVRVLDLTGEFEQKGEGFCDIALIRLIQTLRGSPPSDPECLKKILGTSKASGTEMSDVCAFWINEGVGACHEADVSFNRLRQILEFCEQNNSYIVANVWDERLEPEMTLAQDPPEDHSVMILRMVGKNEEEARIVYFDPRTNPEFHGVRDMSWKDWNKWWHSDPNSNIESNFENGSVAWLMVVGTNELPAEREVSHSPRRVSAFLEEAQP